MSYNCPNGCIRYNYWSNPYVTDLGEAMGSVEKHFNAKVLEETACTVAYFRRLPQQYTTRIALYGVFLADGDAESIVVGFDERFSRIDEVRVRLGFFGDLWDGGESWHMIGVGGQINFPGGSPRASASLRVPYPTTFSQALMNDGEAVATLRVENGSIHVTELEVTVIGLK